MTRAEKEDDTFCLLLYLIKFIQFIQLLYEL